MPVPDIGDVGFFDYGEIDVKTMADHFYSESAVTATELKDEWRKFKYDLANWKKKVPEEFKPKTKTAHGQSTSFTEGTTATSGMQQQKEQAKKKPELKRRQQSSTEWCMQRLIILELDFILNYYRRSQKLQVLCLCQMSGQGEGQKPNKG